MTTTPTAVPAPAPAAVPAPTPERRSRGLYVLLVVGLVLGLVSLGVTWVANDPDSRVARAMASGGSRLGAAEDGTITTWTAAFNPAIVGDQMVLLQVRQIPTKLTYTLHGRSEPVANWQDEASWKTIGLAEPDDGVARFTIENPLGVAHEYRAVVNPGPGALTTPVVTYAAPRMRQEDGLATVYLDTNDGSKVDSKDASWEGRVSIQADEAGTCADVGPLLTKISGRGNSTWDMEKTGLNVTLDKKASLCGLPKSKKWTLLGDYYDRSLIRQMVAMHLGQNMDGLAWTPHLVPVDLYVNREYRGLYHLIERVDIAPDRVNIDSITNRNDKSKPPTDWNSPPAVTGGYLLEWDFRKESDHWVDVNTRGSVTIRQPQDEADGTGITQAQLSYIKRTLVEADNAITAPTFADPATGWRAWVDERSLVDYYLVEEFTKNADSNFNTSVFMYKPRDTTQGQAKFVMGPLWDFDTSMGDARFDGGQGDPTGWYLRDANPLVASQTGESWFNRINQDPQFQAAVAARWQELRPLFASLPDYIDEQAGIISRGAGANFERWDVTEQLEDVQVVRGSWAAEVAGLKGWVIARTAWMDSQFG